MIAMFKRLRVWVVMVLATLLFFPVYAFLDNDDALDIIASFSAVTAGAVIIFYGPAMVKIIQREAGQIHENYHFLLLGVMYVATSTMIARSWLLWWRMWGRAMGFAVDGWVPAFASWLAFVGYMNHIFAPRHSAEGVPISNRKRVLIVLAIAASIGLWFAVNN